MTSVSGLALSIRNSTESDTFDLAGQAPASITSSMTAAFGTPLALSSMIRLTFVTGAGKLGRQKYDEGAAKAVTAALRALGFEEDRAASCVVECAGTFKSQHDTGKNLKTIVVFPRIETQTTAEAEMAGGVSNMGLHDQESTLLPPGTPTHMCAVSSLAVFTKMVAAKCSSWSQKRNCLATLTNIRTMVQTWEDQLGRGRALADADQDSYDSITDLDAKEALLKKEMQAQVEAGQLTKYDQQTLLAQLSEKIDATREDSKQASGKPKKLEKLNAMLEKQQARRTKIEESPTVAPYRLKHEGDIVKLRVEMAPLIKMEDAAKGRLLSMKETMTLARKQDILEEIAEFEKKSRGWFESDEAFQIRLDASRASTQSSAKQRVSKKTSSKSSSTNSNIYKKPSTNWVTPKAQKKPPPKKKAGGAGGPSVFSMMMMDSDSD